MHLLIEQLSDKYFAHQFPPQVLAKNSERFRTLTIGRFKIQDSLDHMSASLDSLVKDLNQTENFTFPIVKQMKRFKKLRARQRKKGLSMLTRKGIFCYEHFKSFKQLQAADKLPPKEAFYSTLNEEAISDEDYEFANSMYKYFKCKNVLDYMMLYCCLDVALLCETFLQYRRMVMQHFELDPAWYLGTFLIFLLKIQKINFPYLQVYPV